MKIWIAGSRTILNFNKVAKLLYRSVLSTDVIRTGGAQGVDRIAEQWAKKRGIEIEPSLKADWRIGKGAGFKRNTEGVEWADKVIVIWNGKSKGTEHVIREAERLEKPLIKYMIRR